ncbi:hypothetical protein B0H11DRAFT_2195679 [Mycena galericulata]|nr:hypothetical protein B0H11DRAFT_2195679 [Mycena galericulata]
MPRNRVSVPVRFRDPHFLYLFLPELLLMIFLARTSTSNFKLPVKVGYLICLPRHIEEPASTRRAQRILSRNRLQDDRGDQNPKTIMARFWVFVGYPYFRIIRCIQVPLISPLRSYETASDERGLTSVKSSLIIPFTYPF